MKIGIIGNGFVGKATRVLECKEIKILVYDIKPELCYPEGLQIDDLIDCSLIFISVPTPMNNDGTCHLNIVINVINKLNSIINKEKTQLVIRSTVLPGTSDKLGTYFMPEFLTEKNYLNDFINCENWIFGLLNKSTDKNFMKNIKNLINIAYKYKKINYNNIFFVYNKEAEMIKYIRNCFLAVKVSFFNEMYEFCKLKDIDYNVVQKIATMDKRIGSSHSSVPGPDNKFGFGGTCFPKDTSALKKEMDNNNMKSYILEGAINRNNEKDRKEKDWEKDKGRAHV
jgi:UDPglucose 6-dehydrogenase